MRRFTLLMPAALFPALVLALAAPLAGCSKPAAEKPASTLTEAQRDSVLGQTNLPGAGTIGRAQAAAAGEATPRVALDSLTQ